VVVGDGADVVVDVVVVAAALRRSQSTFGSFGSS
jgi:hypothetical protein